MMFSKTKINMLNTVSLIDWVVTFPFRLIKGLISSVKIIKHLYLKEHIFYKNLQRPIKVFKPKNCTMDSEIGTLRKSGLFKIDNPTDDLRDIHNVTNHTILVVGYKEEMTDFDKFIDKVMTRNLPLLVYTFGDSNALSKDLRDKLYKYPWYTISNTPLRLLSDVFTISSIYPYEK